MSSVIRITEDLGYQSDLHVQFARIWFIIFLTVFFLSFHEIIN
jgi:hypothetical protein